MKRLHGTFEEIGPFKGDDGSLIILENIKGWIDIDICQEFVEHYRSGDYAVYDLWCEAGIPIWDDTFGVMFNFGETGNKYTSWTDEEHLHVKFFEKHYPEDWARFTSEDSN